MLPIAVLAACLSPVAQDSEKFEFDVRDKIQFSKVGDRELLLDAYVPKKEGTYPCVLVVYGGAWRGGNRKQLAGYAKALTEMGMVCFAIDYRLAPKHKFPAQIDDCRAAVKWIRKNAKDYKANPKKLGAIGYSAGGHLVSLLATTGEAPNEKNGNVDTRLQAVAAGGAPADFRKFPDNGNWAKYLMGGNLDEVPEKFKAASPTAFVDKNDAPTFFFNGTKDRVVPLAWTKPLYESMKAAGVRTEMHLVEGAGHMPTAGNPTALKKAYEFLKRELTRDSVPASSEDTTETPKP